MPWVPPDRARGCCGACRSERSGLQPARGQELRLEGKARQKLVTSVGDQDLLFQLHALRAADFADIALDAQGHSRLEQAIVASARLVVLDIEARGILIAEPDSVEDH